MRASLLAAVKRVSSALRWPRPEPWLASVALGARLTSVRRSLWLDEGFSLSAAGALDEFDAQRPLYFLFLRAWLELGRSELWLRLPSIAFGVASVLVLYRLVERLSGAVPASSAALLLALSPSAVWHAQEVRLYSLATLLCVASAYAIVDWLQTRRTLSLVAFGAAASCGLLTTPAVAFGLVGLALPVVWAVRGEGDRLKHLALTAAAISCVWAPFLYLGLTHGEGTSWVRLPTLKGAVGLSGWSLVGFDMLYGTDDASFPFLRGRLVMNAASLTAIALTAVAFRSRAGLAAAVTFVTAVTGAFAISWLLRPVFVERYMIPLLPALFVAMGVGLERLRSASRVAFGALLVGVLSLEALGVIQQALDQPTEDWRGVARDVAAHVAPQDRVVVSGAIPLGTEPTTVWSYYYAGSAPTSYYDATDPTDASALTLLRRLRSEGSRVWYVYRRLPPGSPHAEVQEQRLAESSTLVFYQGRLGLVVPGSLPSPWLSSR